MACLRCLFLSLLQAQVIALLVAVLFLYPRTYGRGADSFGSLYLPPQLGVLWLVLGALVLAVLLHPNLNGNFMTDTAWTFALYLEAVAVMPQLFMFQKAREKEVRFLCNTTSATE